MGQLAQTRIDLNHLHGRDRGGASHKTEAAKEAHRDVGEGVVAAAVWVKVIGHRLSARSRNMKGEREVGKIVLERLGWGIKQLDMEGARAEVAHREADGDGVVEG